MNMFRELRADEIDCRISQIKSKKDDQGKSYPTGLSLLLYKDARCDQNILDETVGAFNWKREHTRDNRNCIVSIWDDGKKQWISKEDTGTESFTEKEKGLASDSFKRACFNWGIGRELYTAPFIWINAKDCSIYSKDGKFVCYDNFIVTLISYEKGCISGLKVKNSATGKQVFSWGETQEKPEKPDNAPSDEEIGAKKDTSAPVEIADKLPKPEEPQPEVDPVKEYLLKAMKTLREERGISAAQNNKLFKSQKEALVKAGLAPNKELPEYTMEEARSLIDAMYKNFAPEGTEIKQ